MRSFSSSNQVHRPRKYPSSLCVLLLALAAVAGSAPCFAASKPTISSFTAAPASVVYGGSSELRWTTSGATSIAITPGTFKSISPSGSFTVKPTATTTYTLTATNSAGSVEATAAVTVSNPQPITSFTASPVSIKSGASSTLTWTTTGATGIAITPGTFTSTSANGSTTVSPTTTTTYTLTAFGATGTIEANAQVEVTVGASTYFTGNFLAWTGPSVINPKYPFELIRINGTTGLITAIGGQDNFNGLVYGLNGELYGISDHLAIINPATGATSNPVNLTYNGGSPILMCAASISPSGQLYVLEDVSPGRIFEVNMATGALTLVGTAPGLAKTIGFGHDGTLYAGFNELYKLNILNTFSVKDLGSLGFSPLVCIIALSPGAGGILYAMDFQGTCIYSINPTVPSATVVANVGGNKSEWITAFVAEQ